ncbi:MAG TPA: energy transducer TonB [Pyrinomonadaceae bacterium]|nr:energy transducer TonB [Pyrinomonadaceae bacterium]
MTANYSNAARTREYHPTILDTQPLLTRLAIQIAFARNEFQRDPRGFALQLAGELVANKTVLLAVVVIVIGVLLVIDNLPVPRGLYPADVREPPPEIVLMDLRTGPGGVGFNIGSGQGSGPVQRPAQGGGGGGNRDRKPPQKGELPMPSVVLSAIPVASPIAQPALPVAGIEIDPALWSDLKAPVYGDPRSMSETPSKGPGDGEGIGTNYGTGIGGGVGPGVFSGSGGNTGSGSGQNGCCGSGLGGGGGAGGSGILTPAEVDQRVRVLSKPEPQYTEEARRNQVTGTVVLRAVFASSGEVVSIHAVNEIPFGLTEQAIAAARKIKFVPAMKDGRPVSVYLHLEYNFNLY